MKNLLKALAAFQQEVPTIHKGAEGYGYSYAQLSEIIEVITPFLKKYGLGFTQMVEGEGLKTIIFHPGSGETLESITPIPKGVNLKGMNEFQVLGSAITYIRRYALSSMLGLVTDKDTDANTREVSKVTDSAKPWLDDGSPEYVSAAALVMTGKTTVQDLRQKWKISKAVAEKLNAAATFKIDSYKKAVNSAKTPEDIAALRRSFEGNKNEVVRKALLSLL